MPRKKAGCALLMKTSRWTVQYRTPGFMKETKSSSIRSHTRGTEILVRRVAVLWILLASFALHAQEASVKGRVTDPQGNAVPSAEIRVFEGDLVVARTSTGADGQFHLSVRSAGDFVVEVNAPGFKAIRRAISIHGDATFEFRMGELSARTEIVTVGAGMEEADVFSPDPSERIFVSQDLLDANPGRPGAPVSIPGYPIETASGGIKAPQHFAPGVAGDHGEPIAQFITVGSYLVPNNLSANAHGNGYADPNLLIPQVLDSAQIDGGAFNVREGNHCVNLAATYGMRSKVDPFLTITGDYRDIDVVAGANLTPESWIAFEGSYGNGFLDRLEHRQQYKLNGQRLFQPGRHHLTMIGIGYYGQSYVPGLVPIFAPNAGDSQEPRLGETIDPRQKDQSHTALAAVNDVWQLSAGQQLLLSGFFRTYNLALYSNFGDGLIRQSEFRTVTGGSADYVQKITEWLSLLGGLDYLREAPRRDNLDHYGFFDPANPNDYGPFTPVTANNLTLTTVAPYAAANGHLTRWLTYYLGWRRDQIQFQNQDLLAPAKSFGQWQGVNSPKATVSFIPRERWFVPQVAASFGQAFFTNDPRIGNGTSPGTLISKAHSYQLVASKTIRHTDLRLTLGHVTTGATLAKIDPDTGLQENQGPGRLRFLTFAAQQTFRQGSLLATFSKADARNPITGEPVPEAPRTIADFLGTVRKLPFQLQARGEFEFVGVRPLGPGCLPRPAEQCTGTSVKEFRGVLARGFRNQRMEIGVSFLIAGGHTGQTTETFFPSDISEVVGVRIPSYASVWITYRLGRRGP